MKIYTCSISNAIPLDYVSERSTYGLGIFAGFVGGVCEFLGCRNGMYSKKMKKAEAHAIDALKARAKAMGADGVMNVQCETTRLCVLVYGTAFKFAGQ